MARSIAELDVEAEVRELDALGTAALRQRWQSLTGKQPAPGLRGELLRAVLAHWLQEQALGGLRRDLTRHLDGMASGGGRSGRDGVGSQGDAAKDKRPRPLRRLRPGSRLLREWQGRTHEVVVMPEGYLWSGETHASLSTVAKRTTGTSWNGWRFFGVAGRTGVPKPEVAAHG